MASNSKRVRQEELISFFLGEKDLEKALNRSNLENSFYCYIKPNSEKNIRKSLNNMINRDLKDLLNMKILIQDEDNQYKLNGDIREAKNQIINNQGDEDLYDNLLTDFELSMAIYHLHDLYHNKGFDKERVNLINPPNQFNGELTLGFIFANQDKIYLDELEKSTFEIKQYIEDRKKYKNHFKQWTREQIDLLLKMYTNDLSIDVISQELFKKPNAITKKLSSLKKSMKQNLNQQIEIIEKIIREERIERNKNNKNNINKLIEYNIIEQRVDKSYSFVKKLYFICNNKNLQEYNLYLVASIILKNTINVSSPYGSIISKMSFSDIAYPKTFPEEKPQDDILAIGDKVNEEEIKLILMEEEVDRYEEMKALESKTSVFEI